MKINLLFFGIKLFFGEVYIYAGYHNQIVDIPIYNFSVSIKE